MRRTYLWPLMILCSSVLISLALVGDSRLRGQNANVVPLLTEPADSFIFRLELEGQDLVAEYCECFGLGSSNQVEEAVVQTNGGTLKQKTPGELEWHNVTLRRKGPSDPDVWLWRKVIEDRKTDGAFRDGSIVMFRVGSPEALAQWNFSRGWPASLTIEGSVEELTIVHDGVQRVAPSSHRSTKRP